MDSSRGDVGEHLVFKQIVPPDVIGQTSQLAA
jgi:hypothetical protein